MTHSSIFTVGTSTLALLFVAAGCSNGGSTVTDTGNTQDVAQTTDATNTTDVTRTDTAATDVVATDVGANDVVGTDAVATDTATGDSGAAPTCAAYCAAVSASCSTTPIPESGEIPQEYASQADCMATCAAFPLGSTGDTTMNTIACRIYHAGAAAGAPDPHCWHAGPSGFYDGSGCGTSDCESFCTIVMHACTGTQAAYTGMQDCMDSCGHFSDAIDPSTFEYHAPPAGTEGPLGCRMYHATAATTLPNPHCMHVGAVSPVCPNPPSGG